MSRRRVIIDTDPGVDDAAAILVALASPEIEVLGITAVAGNVPLGDTVANACKIVGLTGRCDVPVFAGAPVPLARDQVFGKYARIGSFDDRLVDPCDVCPSPEHAVGFIVRTARAAAERNEPLTICAIGPLTNIALALVQHPDVARGIERIVMMGGAFEALGHRTPWAEFNLYADPHAAAIVFGSGVPIALFPLDVTFQALFTEEHFVRFRERGGVPGHALYNLFSAFDRSDVARFGRPGGPIHDAMPVAWLLDHSLFDEREAFVGVTVTGPTKGHTYVDFRGKLERPANARVVTAVDEAGYIGLVVGRIAAYGRREGGCDEQEGRRA